MSYFAPDVNPLNVYSDDTFGSVVAVATFVKNPLPSFLCATIVPVNVPFVMLGSFHISFISPEPLLPLCASPVGFFGTFSSYDVITSPIISVVFISHVTGDDPPDEIANFVKNPSFENSM